MFVSKQKKRTKRKTEGKFRDLMGKLSGFTLLEFGDDSDAERGCSSSSNGSGPQVLCSWTLANLLSLKQLVKQLQLVVKLNSLPFQSH